MRTGNSVVPSYTEHTLHVRNKSNSFQVAVHFTSFKWSNGRNATIRLTTSGDNVCPLAAICAHNNERPKQRDNDTYFIDKHRAQTTSVSSAECYKPVVNRPFLKAFYSFRAGKVPHTEFACGQNPKFWQVEGVCS